MHKSSSPMLYQVSERSERLNEMIIYLRKEHFQL